MQVLYCKECKRRLFDTDGREIIQIKHPGTEVSTINVSRERMGLKNRFKPIRNQKRYLLDVIGAPENVVKVRCQRCGAYHVYDFATKSLQVVDRDFLPVQ